jgi:hypothetical protein
MSLNSPLLHSIGPQFDDPDARPELLDSEASEGGRGESTNDTQALREALRNSRRVAQRAEAALAALVANRSTLNDRLEELDILTARIGVLESDLRQRHEEIDQTRAELERQKCIAATHHLEKKKLRGQLAEANRWIFRLAGERHELEIFAANAKQKIDAAKKLEDARRAEMTRLDRRLSKAKRELQTQNREGVILAQSNEALRATVADAEEKLKSLQAAHCIELHEIGLELRRLADERGMAEHLKQRAEVEADRSSAEVHKLTQVILANGDELRRYDTLLTSLQAENTHLTGRVATLSAQLADRDQSYSSLLDKCAELTAEIQTKLEQLGAQDQALKDEIELREWLRRLCSFLLQRTPAWWALMPKKWQMRWKLGRLAKAGLFDAATYRNVNSDVAMSDVHPLRHYVSHGIDEGRSAYRASSIQADFIMET